MFGALWLLLFLGLAALSVVEDGFLSDPLLGHFPWPLAEWTLTTLPGTLALAVVAGLLWSVPAALLMRRIPFLAQTVDVTDLPLDAWPRLRPPWGDPARGTRADRWLGRTQRQRVQNLLALALGALLLLTLLAAWLVAVWYGATHFLHLGCSGASCPRIFPPIFTLQIFMAPLYLGVVFVYFAPLAWFAQVQRRCGVWLRTRDPNGHTPLGTYIRRPGVTPEAAARALQRYTLGARPLAHVLLSAALVFIPFFLMAIGATLLSTWLSTQWIP
jgi:hypothetical protein